MSLTAYPTTLPLPLQSGYSTEYKPAVLRTEFADGSAKQRFLPHNASDFSVTCQLLLTGSQFATFWSFYETINFGCDWFTLTLPSEDGGTITKTVRIKEGKIKQSLEFRNDSDFAYKITFSLDVKVN